MELLVDDRERSVIKYLEDYSHAERINYKIQRMTVGDYALTYNNMVVMIIERKTWVDLAASLRDGRKANITKLLTLREETGCAVIYLIEGPTYIKEKTLISNIPFKNLQSHLDHLIFRDNVHVVYAENQKDTARRLFELARNYSTTKPSLFARFDNVSGNTNAAETTNTNVPHTVVGESYPLQLTVVESNDQSITPNQTTTSLTTPNQTTTNNPTNQTTTNNPANQSTTLNTTSLTTPNPLNTTTTSQVSNVNKLTEKQKSHYSVQEQLLRCLPSVGSVLSTLLTENNITLLSIYQGTHTAEHIARLKYTTGASIGLSKAQKIVECRKLLVSCSQLGKKIQLRILCEIPRVSKSTALAIMQQTNLSTILDNKITVDLLKEIQITEKSKLSQKVAENIISVLLPSNEN